MKSENQDDELLRSYLLGKLPDEDADQLERRLLADDELFDLAEAVELDLLAAVDRGALTPEEREEVLRKLAASPRGRERLALARSLNLLAAEQAASSNVRPLAWRASAFPPPAVRWLALAAGLVILAGLAWFALKQGPQAPKVISQLGGQTPTPISQPRIPAAPPSATPLPAKAPGSAPDRPVRRETPNVPTAVLTLSFLASRGGEERAQLDLSPQIRRVEIQIDADGLGDAKFFDVTVRSKDRGALIVERKGIAPRTLSWGSGLVLHIPAERLPAGRYELAVTPQGGEETLQELDVVESKK
jgi:hypothetical protein